MEADWEFEVGGDAPVIDASWSGFVDLRIEPAKAAGLVECTDLRELADVLVKLNSPKSPVWTSKVDVFVPVQVDPYELAASHNEATHSMACYIDTLMRNDRIWCSQSEVEQTCRQLCESLRAVELRDCRIDFVVRRARVLGTNAFGTTVYFTACGTTVSEASDKLSKCLIAFSDMLLNDRKINATS